MYDIYIYINIYVYVRQCSAQVFKRAGCHLKRAHLVSAVNGPSKGHN